MRRPPPKPGAREAWVSEVVLSDGKPALVERLGPFALDDLRAQYLDPHAGLFEYDVLLANGQIAKAPFDLRAVATPPPRPEEPDPTGEAHEAPGSGARWERLEYNRYQAALAWELKKMQARAEFNRAVRQRVLEQCIDEGTRRRLRTPDDVAVVMAAALTPEVTLEDIAAAMRLNFPGQLRRAGDFRGLAAIAGR